MNHVHLSRFRPSSLHATVAWLIVSTVSSGVALLNPCKLSSQNLVTVWYIVVMTAETPFS